MATINLVVVGASAGGVSALQALVGALPADLNAAVLVVLHLSPDAPSLLADILDRSGPLPAKTAQDGERYQASHIYVAPPARHMLVTDGRLALRYGPKENRFRPSIDVLFRSAALAHGYLVTGVVLTGLLDDGTAGLKAIKECGGIAVVQSPEEARYPSMPESALRNVEVDHCLPIGGIANLLAQMSNRPMKDQPTTPAPTQVEIETRIQMQGFSNEKDLNQLGVPSVYACPECHGCLWEIQDAKLVRYRCRTGHAYSGLSLLAEQTEAKESDLWSLLRGLEELESLAGRLAAADSRLVEAGQETDLQRYVNDIRQKIVLLRQIVAKEEMAEAAGVAALALKQHAHPKPGTSEEG